MTSCLIIIALTGVLPGTAGPTGLASAVLPPGEAQVQEGRETLCYQPGLLGAVKIPADSAEVANDCEVERPLQIVHAIWWGGYMEWEAGDPQVTEFDVRFYKDDGYQPGFLLAEYLGAEPEIISLGNCTDGLPCFRYELAVSVPFGPGPFWFSVQVADPDNRYLPKWGRLGDDANMGSPNHIRNEGDAAWLPLNPLITDASQAFGVERPTAESLTTWGRIKARFGP